MSFFGDPLFFFCLILLLIPAVALGVMEKTIRWYGLFCSLLFIAVIFGPKPRQLVFLTLFYLLELGLVQGYVRLRNKYGRNSRLYGSFVVAALVPLALSKLSEQIPLNLFQFLGVSYLTFRTVQMIIETYDGLISKVNTLEFTGYLLFFPALSSGPIDRSRRFSEDWNRIPQRPEYLELVGNGLEKLLLGAVYKFVLSVIFFRCMGFFQSGDGIIPLIGYGYSYGFYMFFDFAGYSLMAIGTSYFLGIRTPDNFNQPFRSIDIKDFWNRWHMTLSYWFRDFLFSRFMMQSIRRKWFSSKLTGAAAGFLVNMLVMGLWHGPFLQYILYGLYHGVLLAGTEVYQKKSTFYKKHKKNRWYRGISWFITLNLVMFGFLLFSGRLIK